MFESIQKNVVVNGMQHLSRLCCIWRHEDRWKVHIVFHSSHRIIQMKKTKYNTTIYELVKTKVKWKRST